MQKSWNINSLCAGIVTGLTVPQLAQAEQIEQVSIVGQRLSSISSLAIDSELALAPDLRDVLARLPGVDANSNGAVNAIAQYRGLFGDRLRVNIDGAPVVGSGPNGMDPPLSNVFATPGTTVNLYRGVAPVVTGPETLGGTISVTRDYADFFSAQPMWRAGLNLQRQNQGSAEHYQGTLGYYTDNVFVDGFAADQQRGNVRDGEDRIVPNSFYERSAFGITAGVRWGKHQFVGTFQRINTDDSGTAPLAMDIIYVDSDAYRIHYQWQDSSAGTLSLRMFGNSNQHGMNNTDHRPATMPMGARFNTVDSLSRGYEALWTQDWLHGELQVGADWFTASHNSVITNHQLNTLSIRNFNDVERTVQSLFGQWQREYAHFDLTAGLRFTEVDAEADPVAHSMAMMNPNVASLVNEFNGAERDLDFSFVDVTLHLNGALADNWQWHLAAGQKGRAPSYTELYVWFPLGISAGLADGRNYLGNLNLEEESSRQIDVGVTYQAERLTVSPRIFYQNIDDYIVGSPSSNQTANMVSTMLTGRPPLEWSNADATLYGFDMLLTAQLARGLQLEMTASIVRGDRDDIDESLYRISPASLSTRLIWQHQRWHIQLESQLVANQSHVSVIQDEEESAGYGIANATFTYQFDSGIRVSAIANNLFDKAYQPHLGGVNRIAGIDQSVGERLFAPGRTLGLNLSFDY